ncbi:hypothetical protein [Enterococcus sp. AZ196]|uniref:hypothetical protein n=1 Tax=Enterococcus sp. AZ196 TaxID=2774659 RepID=UPI003D2C2ABE
MMKVNEQHQLRHIAYDINDLNASVGLVQSYISSLQLQAQRANSDGDRLLIFYDLFHEKGFDNISGVLDSASKTIDSVTNELLDRSEMAVTAND